MRLRNTVLPLAAASVLVLPGCGADPASDGGPAAAADSGVEAPAVPSAEALSFDLDAAMRVVQGSQYTLRAEGGSVRGHHPAFGWTVDFSDAGLRIEGIDGAPQGAVTLRWGGFGRGEDLDRGPATAPRLGACDDRGAADLDGDCQRVGEERIAGVRHEIRQDESALEHRFFVPAESRPEGEGPLRFQLHLDGARALLDLDGLGAAFVTARGPALRYDALHAWDSRGNTVPARLEPREAGFDIVVDDALAEGDLWIDPIFSPDSWNFAGSTTGEQLGWSVSTAGDLNGDGLSDVAVGAPFYFGTGANAGRVLVWFGSDATFDTTPDITLSGNVGQRLGTSIAALGDADGDGDWELAVGAPGTDNAFQDEGAVYVIEGEPTGPYVLGPFLTSGGATNAGFGERVAAAGDVNGDGFADLLASAPLWDNGSGQVGQVRLFLGASFGLNSSPAWARVGTTVGGEFGWAISGTGDWNGDGFDDFAVGAPSDNSGGVDAGKVFVYEGSTLPLATAAAWTATGTVGSSLGSSIARLGDVQRDGFSDFAAGAPEYDVPVGPSDAGQVQVWYGTGSGTPSTPSWSRDGEAAGLFLGTSVAGAGDVDGDGWADFAAGAPGASSLGPSTGRIDIYAGGPSGLTATNFSIIDGPVGNAQFGFAVANAGDINGDGVSDLVVGAPYEDPAGTDSGRVRLYFGQRHDFDAAQSVQFGGEDAGDSFGTSVSWVGDVNGDGFSDFAFGAPGYDDTAADTGAAFLYFGGTSGPVSSPSWTAVGSAAGVRLGGAISSAGDVNLDGYGDIVVGAPDSDLGGTNAGGFYTYLGGASGPSAVPTYSQNGATSNGRLGASAAFLGDVDGDGLTDFAVGAPFEGAGGQVYVFMGDPVTPTAQTISTATASSAFGQVVAPAGDLNGDGFADLAVGAPGFSSGRGAAYVYAGSALGPSSVPAWSANGPQPNTSFGSAIAALGDVNDDGNVDLLIGAPGYDDSMLNRGRAELFYGTATWPGTVPNWTTLGPGADDRKGGAVVALGDIDGNGVNDFAIGVPGADAPFQGAGEVDVYLSESGGPAAAPSSILLGSQADEELGTSLSAADFNGDGRLDLIASAPLWDNGTNTSAGRLHMFPAGSSPLTPAGPGIGPLVRTTAGGQIVPPWGGLPSTTYTVEATHRSIEGRSRLRLALEDEPSTLDFDGDGISIGAYEDSTTSAVRFGVAVDALVDDSWRHGRVRLEADPAHAPLLPWTGWIPLNLGAPPGNIDLRTGGTVGSNDSDGDFSPDSVDCAPNDATVYPGATEVCDQLDTDCDGAIPPDELDNDADGVAFCEGDCNDVDLDGDGFALCEGDCDDIDPTRSPALVEACDGVDNNCDGNVPGDESDIDSDGFRPCAGDCNDVVADIHPGALEVCDGVDQDCDTVTPGEEDLDNDGIRVCANDCDDDNSGVAPGRPEVCDGLDTDCDGNLPGFDLDADGDESPGCEDCADDNELIHPGASELCDGLDGDCDGSIPADEADSDSDGASICMGDCNDTNAAVSPAAVEVCDGADEDCDGAIDASTLNLSIAPSVPVWDLGSVSISIPVLGSLPVLDVDVIVDIDHTRTADLDLFLEGPTGLLVELSSDNGSGGDHYSGTVFDDEATTAIVAGVAPFAGVFQPEESLSAFDRTTPAGNWTLAVVDDLSGQQGVLQAWGLTLVLDGAADVDGDGVDACADCDDLDPARAPSLAELCTGEDEDCDGVLDPTEVDVDGDAFSSCDGDCDETAVDRYPGAVDVPSDGIDQDCDGFDANPVGVCFVDGDGDGVGSASTVDSADADCDDLGEADAAGDCDDAESARAPGLLEVCDAVDNDCDAATDEGTDNDADGLSLCEGDCDDGNVAIGPGFPELCDGIDNDCIVGGDELGDGDGDLVSPCEGDCDDLDPFTAPGAEELCDSADNDCDGSFGPAEIDGDGDLVAGCDGDCDDANDQRFPDAVELCNGLDDDCTGLPLTTEFDPDGDAVPACAGDCAAFDPIVHPGAPEACDGLDGDCDGAIPAAEVDADSDSVLACAGDCDDNDASTFPGAPEPPQGPDRNCDGLVGDTDADEDGFTVSDGDCNDADAAVHPDAAEICDGQDTNCDGEALPGELMDLDGDGFVACLDCQPWDANIHPGALEICDGLDDDCDGYDLDAGEVDFDRDGAFGCQGDCDDLDAAVREGLAEDCDDGLDNDCDGTVDYNTDADHDGVGSCDGDCRDNNADISPDEPELCNGIDEDCDGVIDNGFDADGDGFSPCAGDCDDAEATAWPGAPVVCNDGLDNDCVPTTQEDVDSDGDGSAACSDPGDCWEGNPNAYPGAAEVCDLADNDCDGEADEGLDADGDGWASCRFDCDDADPLTFPGGEEICDAGDEDCDGEFDEDCEDEVGDDDSAEPSPADGCNCEGSMAGSGPGALLSVLSLMWAKRRRSKSVLFAAAALAGCGGGDGGNANGAGTPSGEPVPPSGVAEDVDIARAIAADAIRFVPEDGGLRSTRAAQRLSAVLLSQGLRVEGKGSSLSLRLDAVGRPGQMVPFSAGAPREGQCTDDGAVGPDGACLRYAERADAGVTERWQARPEGWAHSFVVQPTAGVGPLVLALGTDAELVEDAGAAVLRRGALALRYASVRAWDSAGRALSARLVVLSDRVEIEVDDTGALGPITVDPLLTNAAPTLDGGQAGGGFGAEVIGLGDIDGDGFGDLAIGAPGWDLSGVDRGRVQVHLGAVGGPPSTAHRILDGFATGDQFGAALAAVGDLDGDGLADLAVGSPDHDGARGRVDVWFGSASGIGAVPGWTLLGTEAGARLGSAIAGGDINGDGAAELIVGEPGYSAGTPSQGRIQLWSGLATGQPGTLQGSRTGGLASAAFGASVAFAGDSDGDGFGDVLVGSPGWASPNTGEGAAWLIGGAAGPGLQSGSLWTVEGGTDGAMFGFSVACVGDSNGDGSPDLLVGAPGMGVGGEARLYLGAPGGPATFASWSVTGAPGDALGTTVAAAGDINGDGRGELAVGSPAADGLGADQGWAQVFLGADGGALLNPVAVYAGTQDASGTGGALAATDLDGDGFSDLIVGAAGQDVPDLDAGRVTILAGAAALPALVEDDARLGGQSLANLGHALAFVGDVDADGFDDAVLGAWHYSQGQTNEGAAFLYLGARDGLAPNASWSAQGDQSNAFFGAAVSGAGDINGDGYADVVVGAYGWEGGAAQSNEGQARLYLGSASGLGVSSWMGSGGTTNANFGYSIAAAGDVNADGYGDIIIGARQWPGAGGTGVQRGGVTLWLGAFWGFSGAYNWGTEGSVDYDQLGTAVAGLGDVNGDGFSDIAIGAPHPGNNLADEGYVRVYHGWGGGLHGSPQWQLSGLAIGDQFGAALAGGIDYNGDRYADLAVGAPDAGAGDVGEIQLFPGGPTGLAVSGPTLAAPVGADDFGAALSTAGDLDQDGDSELIVGDPGFTSGQSGEGYAALVLGGALAATPWSIEGGQGGAGLGFSVGGGGDIDGDGRPDLLVGAWQYDGTLSGEGRVQVFFGGGGEDTGVAIGSNLRLWDGARRVHPQARVTATSADAEIDATPIFGALGRTRIAVQAEPHGQAFAPGSSATRSSWVPATLPGATLSVPLTLSPFDTGFHTRARVEPDPALGGGWMPGPWRVATHLWEPQGVHLRSGCDFDFDGDGSCDAVDINDDDDWFPDLLDCEPLDATIYDGAPEVADDGIDQDCNGSDAVTCWDDADQDGFGTGLSYLDDEGCTRVDQVTQQGDCDESRPEVHTGAEELCDGLDTDCFNGPGTGGLEPDEGDADGDLYLRCSGFVDLDAATAAGGDDCDDTLSTVHPTAFEATNDCLDTDCVNGPAPVELSDTDFDLSPGCDDCDDTDPLIRNGFAEICDSRDNDCDLQVPVTEADTDGDGFAPCEGDCDDTRADRYPGAPETSSSTTDFNCDGVSNCDCDGDRQTVDDGDCDDANGARGSGDAFPEVCDGIDNDCDGVLPPGEGFDDDGDGVLGCEDCNDSDPDVLPGGAEACDGRDGDCDGYLGLEELDLDQDGVPACGGDCDDNNAAAHPGLAEDCTNGVDDDCVGGIDGAEPDADGDGVGACDGDCDDGDAGRAPGVNDLCDGIDNDCDGEVDPLFDGDRDGFSDDCSAPADCDDTDPSTYPGAPPQCDDHADNDCDPATDEWLDNDGDGLAGCPDGDCDDTDAGTSPIALEQCNGEDDDCDGLADEGLDLDGDGRLPCTGDCLEDDERVNTGLEESCDDAVDNDCDQLVDEDCAQPVPNLEIFIPLGCTCGTTTSTGAGAVLSVLGLVFALRRRRSSRWSLS